MTTNKIEIGKEAAFMYGQRAIMGKIIEIQGNRVIIDATSSDRPRGFKPGKYSVSKDEITVF